MANKSNHITVTALREAIKDKFDNTVIKEWNGLEITIKHTLTLGEMFALAQGIVEACFDEDNRYVPEKSDFAMRLGVIELYTNLTLPKDLEEQYDILYRTDIFEFVLGFINSKQFGIIVRSIDERIEQINRINASNVESQLNSMCAAIDNIQQQMSDIFNGVDAETINKLAGAMINTQLDEEKLVRAIVDTHNGNN